MYKMFKVIQKIFVVTVTFLVLNVNSFKCVSMKNQECKVREEIISVNNNEPVFYPFNIKVNECSGSCNNINDPHAKLCVSDVVKNINVKVFNLMSWSNQAKHIKWHETCKCECKLNSSVCNNKQRRNKDKCRCECKELVDKQECNKGFIFNPNNCNCECNKSCSVEKCLDHKNCKCRKKVVDLLVEKCYETINETLSKISLNDYKCSSCRPYVVLFIISVIISSAFIYFYWYSKKFYCQYK